MYSQNWSADFDSYGTVDLNETLLSFYAAVQNAKGQPYSFSSFVALKDGIQRHFPAFNFVSDKTFQFKSNVFKTN